MPIHATDPKRPSLPLSPEYLQQLAHCLARMLEHFCRYQSSRETHFRASIRVIADCYSLVLLAIPTPPHQDHRLEALNHFDDFKQSPEVISKLPSIIAEMISHVADQVRLMDQPWFYDHFASAINNVLSSKASLLCLDSNCLAKLRAVILSAHPSEVK